MTIKGVKVGHMIVLAGTGLGLLAAVARMCQLFFFVVFFGHSQTLLIFASFT